MQWATAALLTAAALANAQVTARPNAGPSFETLSRQADQARDAEHLDEALVLYNRALKLRPNWDEGWWDVGSISYDRDKYPECVAAFRKLTALKPELATGWTMLGMCEYRLREYDSALKSLLQVERLKFQEPAELSRAARLHLAILLTKAGIFEKPLVLLTELTRIDRKTPEIVTSAGIAGLRQPWLPSEVPEAERDKVWRTGDAMAAAMEMDPNAAVAKFEAVIRDYPAEANIHYRFGAFLLQQQPDRGIEEIKKALDLEPAHVPALVGLAMTYLKRGEPQTSLEYAQKAAKNAPGDFAAHIALGRALLDTEDAAGAARELEVAVKLAPGSPEARFSLASAYARLGRKADADREHEEFKRLKNLVDSNQPQK